MRNLGLYLIKDRKHVAWVVLVLALLPFLGLPTAWLCIVILGLMTLQKGAKEGLWVLAWTLLPAIAISFWGYPAFLLSLGFRGLFVWLLALLLRRFQSWAIILEIGAIVGVVTILLLHLLFPHIREWWFTHLIHQANELNRALDLNLKSHTIQSWSHFVSGLATGLIGAITLSIDIFLLMLSRAWQAALFKPGSFRSEFYRLRIGHTLGILLIITVLLSFFDLGFVLDTLPLLLMPFVFAGLSLLHVLMHGRRGGKVILGIVYFLVLVLLPYIAILLALLGWIDSWLDLRRRYGLGPFKR